VAIIGIGLKSAGLNDASAYATWLHAIPLEFFSLAVIAISFLSIYFNFHRGREARKPAAARAGTMKMAMDNDAPAITPRLVNLVVPMLLVIGLSVFFFWYFGREPGSHTPFLTAITHTDRNGRTTQERDQQVHWSSQGSSIFARRLVYSSRVTSPTIPTAGSTCANSFSSARCS